MKYSRLTQEQFEELHKEFINFLATQTITAKEWNDLKKENPKAAEDELDVFSDLIWEGVLNKAKYLENIAPQQLHLFHLEKKQMSLLVVKVSDPSIDIMTQNGFDWLKKNMSSDVVELLTGTKNYSEDKNLDKFRLIEQGAVISKGVLFKNLYNLINNSPFEAMH